MRRLESRRDACRKEGVHRRSLSKAWVPGKKISGEKKAKVHESICEVMYTRTA